MQRLAVVIAISLVFVLFYYYTPLRDLIAPVKESTKSSLSQKKSDKESQFDELRIELYAVTNKLANLQGKVQLLKIAQEHRDWFKEEEYTQLPILLTKAEEDLKQTEQEFEKIKDKYARETVINMVKESFANEANEKGDSSE